MPRFRRFATAITAIAVAVTACTMLAGCGFVQASRKSDTKPGGFVLSGDANVTLPPGASLAAGSLCTSPAGATDVAPHARVIVTDSSGKKIASGSLTEGVVAIIGTTTVCEFPFTIRGVPDRPDVYHVAIGNRPSQAFPASDLRTGKPAILAITSAAR